MLLLVGCGRRDAAVLDRFSRLYSSFLDTELDASAVSLIPVIRSEDNPNNPFWAQLRAALDLRSTNSARIEAASACIAAYDKAVSPYLNQLSEKVGDLNQRVLELIEVGNAVHDREYRADALEVAKSARDIQSHLASISQLLSARFDAQRKVMERVVANHGDVLQAVMADPQGAQGVQRISKELDEQRASFKTAEQKYRDTFSALKGKAGLTHYPNKYDK
jgi:hypothetical protein